MRERGGADWRRGAAARRRRACGPRVAPPSPGVRPAVVRSNGVDGRPEALGGSAWKEEKPENPGFGNTDEEPAESRIPGETEETKQAEADRQRVAAELVVELAEPVEREWGVRYGVWGVTQSW